ncbi:MAG: hypothetical protein OSA38_04460 [Candidatus Poseidoniaceae archaeon]|mgnify:FL=1|nr:hypothetical protein [Candidatus Poseidoniaceae archaeon]
MVDAWADVETAIEAAIKQRQQRLERLTSASALLLLSGALWLMWPSLNAAMNGESGLLKGLGLPLVIIVWGLIIQDLVVDDARARTRVGSAASVAWPVLLVTASQSLDVAQPSMIVGSVLIAMVALCCLNASKSILQGGLNVLRWRAVMTGLGAIVAVSLFAGNIPESMTYEWLTSVAALVLSFGLTGYIWVVGDDQRAERKKFSRRLDEIEGRLLELKASGAAVDQASSLIMTAREEGHVDPHHGMNLLNDAEDDIERSLSLSGDVEAIRADARASMDEAESIAPTAKRPRKSFDMGEREVKLGSLRDGEMLFRQSKKYANEIIEWWAVAEKAIGEAGRQLQGKSGDGVDHLREMLADARKKLASEAPKKAYEFAVVIPVQLAADDDALGKAAMSLKEAERQLKQTDGLDITMMTERLAQAEAALDDGNSGQAIGLADGVVRSIQSEREAMDDVQRALRQRKKLSAQYESRDDRAQWDGRIQAIEQAADERRWSEASELLATMNQDLDKEGKASEEALELYDFVMDEWRTLRNQCEAGAIKVDDDDRRATEQAIALAEEGLSVGRIEDCLDQLGIADAAMERLRRRI